MEQDWRASERKRLTPLLNYRFNGNSAATSIDLSKLWKIAAVAAGVGLTALLLWFLLR